MLAEELWANQQGGFILVIKSQDSDSDLVTIGLLYPLAGRKEVF